MNNEFKCRSRSSVSINITYCFIVTLAVYLLFSILVPLSAAESLPKPVTELISRAKAEVKTIKLVDFKKVMDRKGVYHIIDVREPNEYNAGHIPGAINIPRGVIEFRIWALTGYPEKTDTSIELYLYCKTGGRCALAAKSLKELGFANVVAVDMRFADWQAAGYPTTEPEPSF